MTTFSAGHFGLFVLFLLLATSATTHATPISNPHLNDSAIHQAIPDYFVTKERKNYLVLGGPTSSSTSEPPQVVRQNKDPECSVEFRLHWSANVGSAVVSTPSIFPAGPSGRKQIFLTTAQEYVEVLSHDGHKPWGWPLSFEGNSFRGSPVLLDVDGDGTLDMCVADRNANLYWVRVGSFGEYLEDYHVTVPRLKVAKDWAASLDPQWADRIARVSMFDSGGGYGAGEGITRKRHAKKDSLSAVLSSKRAQQVSYPEPHEEGEGAGMMKRRLLAVDAGAEEATGAEFQPSGRSGDDDAVHDFSNRPAVDDAAMTDPLRDSEGKFFDPDFGDYLEPGEGDHYHYGMPGRLGSEEGRGGGVENGYTRDFYYGGMDPSGGLGAEYFNDTSDGAVGGAAKEYLFVDPHILSSPTLADVNGDGHLELVIAVSYYFDAADYAGKNPDFDVGNYVAGAIICWDIEGQRWSWSVNLDLTTDRTEYKAFIYGSPTVADLDGDGRSEVIVGTSMGLLYVLDGETGFVRRHFPMQFGKIESQVAVADVTGDGALEIIVADMLGNVVLVTPEGETVWDAKLQSSYGGSVYVSYTPSIGDVNADGQLDVVVVATEGEAEAEAEGGADQEHDNRMVGNHSGRQSRRGKFKTKKGPGGGSVIWAFDGKTGVVLTGYPIALPPGADISAPILMADLHIYEQGSTSDPSLPPWMRTAVTNSSKSTTNEEATDGGGASSAAWDAGSLVVEAAKLRRGGNVVSNRDAGFRGAGLHLIVPSYDGHIYVVDGVRGCAESLDVGEHLFSMPLLEDITGDGFLDLLVGTVGGEVLLFDTVVPYHATNAWPSFPKHRMNGFTHGVVGISIPASVKRSLAQADLQGDRMSVRQLLVTFDIHDNRAVAAKERNAKYYVVVTRGTHRMQPLVQAEYFAPGRYTIAVPVLAPESSTLVFSMTTEHGQYHEDALAVSVNTRFYIWIKYLVFVPVLVLCLPMLLMKVQS